MSAQWIIFVHQSHRELGDSVKEKIFE